MSSDTADSESLGSFLKSVRNAVGLTLRQVEQATEGRIKNSYLSQVENGDIRQPSIDTLYELSQVYAVDYGDLLLRAGHRIPEGSQVDVDLAGIPLNSLRGLTPTQKRELVDYIAYLRQKA